jgi:5-methylthioadenosine/S-adenosylhomocysteine deaminase
VDIILENATVVTMNEGNEVLDPGWIDIRDGAIAAVSATPLQAAGAARRIDGRGKVVMPGLVNAHTHLFQTFLRGVYEHLPFAEWLRRIYHCGRALGPEDSRLSAMLGCLESLKGGVTTVLDHQFLNRGNELAEATLEGMRAVGVRTALARTMMDLGDLAPPEALETPEEALRWTVALLANHKDAMGDGMLTLMVGPNTPGVSASGEAAVAMQRFALERGLRVSAHVAESCAVLEAVRRRYAQPGVIAWLEKLGALGPNWIAAHSVHLSPEEIAIMARRGVCVAHNPVSNMFLGDGIAPIVEMLKAGVTVGLGTDGAASNNSQDMFEVLKVTPFLQRARLQDAQAVPPTQALRMATMGGARALGLDHLVGSLEPGKRADLIVLDLRAAPHNVAVHNVVSHLVQCAKATDVELTMVDGRILMEGRNVAGVDEPALLVEAQAAAEHLVRRLTEHPPSRTA